MKKYLLGSLAVVIALAAVAFTTPRAKFDTYYFKYTAGTGGYTNSANWSQQSTPFSDCLGSTQTCTVESNSIVDVSALITYFQSNNPESENGLTYDIKSQQP